MLKARTDVQLCLPQVGQGTFRKFRPAPTLYSPRVVMGALIYAITFTRWGGAVQTQAERPPEVRTRRMTFVAASVAMTYGIATAYATRAMKPRPEQRLLDLAR